MTDQSTVRQHILDAARPVILHKGFTAAGLSEILRCAAVPKGSFYHYFKSKELFGEAMLDAYFSDYLARLDGLLTDTGEPAAQRLMAYWSLWMETQLAEDSVDKCLAVKLSGEVSDLSEAMRCALHKGTSRIVERLSRCIGEGRSDGSVHSSLSPDQLAEALYQMWLGATLLTKVRRDDSALKTAMLSTRAALGLAACRT